MSFGFLYIEYIIIYLNRKETDDGNEDVNIHDHPLAGSSNEVNYDFISVYMQEEVCSAKRNSQKKGVQVYGPRQT